MPSAPLRNLKHLLAGFVLAAFAFVAPQALAQAQPTKAAVAKPAATKTTPADAAACLGCHQPVKAFYDSGKHTGVSCTTCHSGTEGHLKDIKARPVTKTDPAVCGGCHQNQYTSLYTMNYEKTARKSKSLATGPSPNPAFDKLMSPHGFTREHNVPRSHAFALYDQYVVDRAFGGRFENKEGWRGLAQPGGNFKVWDVIVDKYPGEPHKVFKPGTAAAANPVCMSCKTADHILDWAYLGDPVPGAKWSRTSKVNEFVKDTNHALNCIFCHDPHSAKPRIIRDGLIQALTRPEKDTLWHKDARAAKIEVKDLGRARLHAQDRDAGPLRHQPAVRPVPRRVQLQPRAPTRRPASRSAWPTRGPTTSRSRTSTTSASTTPTSSSATSSTASPARCCGRRSTPTSRTTTSSKHQKAGVECSSCHMPKVKDQEDRQDSTRRTGRPRRSTTSRKPACSATAAGARSRRCT